MNISRNPDPPYRQLFTPLKRFRKINCFPLHPRRLAPSGLEEDDAELITETLQKNIDRRVIEYPFGPKVPVLVLASWAILVCGKGFVTDQ